MTNDSTFFENELLEFIGEPGPLSDMMRWLAEQLMEIEVPKKASPRKESAVRTKDLSLWNTASEVRYAAGSYAPLHVFFPRHIDLL